STRSPPSRLRRSREPIRTRGSYPRALRVPRPHPAPAFRPDPLAWDDPRPMIDWYRQSILEPGRSGVFWMLVAFVVTFVVTRLLTRRIRARAEAAAARGERSRTSDIHIGG